MRDDFLAAIRSVWAKLGLGEPRITDPKHLRLRIEGQGIDLLDSGTGLVLVEGIAGRFSADPFLSARQTRRVLDTNLGLLLDSHAAVFVRHLPDGGRALVVRSSYSLASNDIDLLLRKIEDTLQSMEYYGAEFKLPSHPAPRPVQSDLSTLDTAIIFRP